MSLTSSCEIVDALEDAANDVSTPVNQSKEPSPAVELSWLEGAQSMTASQYAQVVSDWSIMILLTSDWLIKIILSSDWSIRITLSSDWSITILAFH